MQNSGKSELPLGLGCHAGAGRCQGLGGPAAHLAGGSPALGRVEGKGTGQAVCQGSGRL